MISCSSYLEELRPQLCTLVVTRLADKVLHFSHREPNLTKVSHINPISEKELNRLQYLAGYVVFKLLKKTEKCKECNSPENQYTVRILAGMRTEDFADQKLIHSLIVVCYVQLRQNVRHCLVDPRNILELREM